ncbi:hypothetical protein CC1G_14901 [Coprinopsis cinerea okayama7|uniref:Metallothionein n=1 Tax=Coprinopsis cinerea (strain Okayama-7 / 130 / ATCC MYA-4618 / FGSC 9003) TaxID=240176 RepID=D6RNL4_COPC7|nr:hypothetical protein CC1G_14901 [Coprinopsis cinerea okayama7\|eukprot:XP_002910924.1 hypothetical protein CC1G_14901 [Coprinopsis cinerea okayama7\
MIFDFTTPVDLHECKCGTSCSCNPCTCGDAKPQSSTASCGSSSCTCGDCKCKPGECKC